MPTVYRKFKRQITDRERLEISEQITKAALRIEEIQIMQKEIKTLREQILGYSKTLKYGFIDGYFDGKVFYNTPEPGKKTTSVAHLKFDDPSPWEPVVEDMTPADHDEANNLFADQPESDANVEDEKQPEAEEDPLKMPEFEERAKELNRNIMAEAKQSREEAKEEAAEWLKNNEKGYQLEGFPDVYFIGTKSITGHREIYCFRTPELYFDTLRGTSYTHAGAYENLLNREALSPESKSKAVKQPETNELPF